MYKLSNENDVHVIILVMLYIVVLIIYILFQNSMGPFFKVNQNAQFINRVFFKCYILKFWVI